MHSALKLECRSRTSRDTHRLMRPVSAHHQMQTANSARAMHGADRKAAELLDSLLHKTLHKGVAGMQQQAFRKGQADTLQRVSGACCFTRFFRPQPRYTCTSCALLLLRPCLGPGAIQLSPLSCSAVQGEHHAGLPVWALVLRPPVDSSDRPCLCQAAGCRAPWFAPGVMTAHEKIERRPTAERAVTRNDCV